MNRPVPKSEKILSRRKAKKEAYCNVTYQLECLKMLHDELYPSSMNQSSTQSPINNPKSLLKLRELKAILRNQYRGNFPLPSLEQCIALVLFDDKRRPFFEFRFRPTFWPEGWPFFIDDNPESNVILYSEAIYYKVMEAFEEEGTVQTREGVVNSTGENIANSEHAEGDVVLRVNIKSEDDDEETMQPIVLEDENSDQAESNEGRLARGGVVSRPNSAHSNPPSNSNSQHQQFSGVSLNPPAPLGSKATEGNRTYSRVGEKRSADTGIAHLSEPYRIPKRHNSSAGTSLAATPASTASTTTPNQSVIVEDFLSSAAFIAAQGTDKLNCPLCSAPYEKLVMGDHINISHFRKQMPYRCTWPACRYTNVWLVNGKSHVRREHQADPDKYIVQSSDKAGSSATLSLYTREKAPSISSSSSSMTSIAESFLASPAYLTANSTARLFCPLCSKHYAQRMLKDHLMAMHLGRKLYHCTWTGCQFTSGYFGNAQSHVKDVHQADPEKFIKYIPDSGLSSALPVQAPATSAAKSVSTSSNHTLPEPTAEAVKRFLTTSTNSSARSLDRIKCLFCAKRYMKKDLKDHLYTIHLGKKPHQCVWSGCNYSNGYYRNVQQHLKKVHNSTQKERYIVFRG
ncbi:hypothetical protein TYRP_017908 [Tyrophagus putrescentiae]|nr:hypothetical protein TYRP_017908 [Tyrophagus putrescentiae]